MERPPYNYQALQKELKRIENNIRLFENEIEKEKKRRIEIEFYIQQHEKYRKWQIAQKTK